MSFIYREKLDVDAFFTRLFIDVTQVESEYDKYDLIHRFWLMASLMQCLDRQVPIWDIFYRRGNIGLGGNREL